MNKRFYKNKSVLVTGHTGFVGSWMTLWLNKAGANVIGLSHNPPSNPYNYKFLKLDNSIHNIKGDVRNLKFVTNIIKDYQPDIIIHLAAQPILLKSYEDPVYTYTTNAIGTLNILEASHKVGVARVILNITSDKVYDNIGIKKKYTEEDRFGGFDPYSSSKACAELITQAYKNSFFSDIGVATARAGNIIGGGDWGIHRLVPDIFNAWKDKKTLTIRHPEGIRPWTYILDVLNGYLLLSEKLYKNKAYSGGWNFSSEYVKSVISLINEFSKYWNINYTVVPEKKHEDRLLLLDSSKSKKELNWSPKFTFAKTIKETSSWYNIFYGSKGRNILNYSIYQLENFERLDNS